MTKFMHLSFFGSPTNVSFHLHIDCKRIKIQEYEKKQKTSRILISNVIKPAMQLVYDIVTPSLTHLTT